MSQAASLMVDLQVTGLISRLELQDLAAAWEDMLLKAHPGTLANSEARELLAYVQHLMQCILARRAHHAASGETLTFFLPSREHGEG